MGKLKEIAIDIETASHVADSQRYVRTTGLRMGKSHAAFTLTM